MSGVNPSVFVRIPFTVGADINLSDFNQLVLSMKYDDAFIAYINGTRVAASPNAPVNPTWNSAASAIHADTQAVVFQDYDISEFRNLLREGNNMLAIQALNSSSTSSDLLCLPRLSATKVIGGAGASPD